MFDNSIKKFTNCYILRDNEIIKEDLWARGGKIINPEPLFFEEKIGPSEVIDCNGSLIAPGLIDLQINGGFGVDFSKDMKDEKSVRDSIRTVARKLLAHGVTSFCPTLVTSPPEVYHTVLKYFKRQPGSKENGANVLGLHLEGPFISKEKKGAHPEQYLQDLKGGFKDVEDTYGKDLSNVDIITMAPELDKECHIVKTIRDKGVLISLGHSMANLKDGEEAVKNGASLITHLFNAMSAFHHRDPGLIGLLTTNNLDHRKVHYGIIADGVHCEQASLKLAYNTNYEGMCLITDGIVALGLEDGVYTLGEQCVEVKGLRAVVVGTNTLCGAIGNLFDAVKNLHDWAECSWVDAINAATLHPAIALKLKESKGTLKFEGDADFILLNLEEFKLKSTWISGNCVYQV